MFLKKDQEKPATPPSSASKEKEENKNVEEVKVTQTEGKDSEDVKVTESQKSDILKEGGVTEEKVESKEPAVSDEKDPTEIGETKKENEDTEKKTVKDSSECLFNYVILKSIFKDVLRCHEIVILLHNILLFTDLDIVSKSLIESQSLINIKYSLNSEFSLHASITVNVSESGSGSWKTVFKFKPG